MTDLLRACKFLYVETPTSSIKPMCFDLEAQIFIVNFFHNRKMLLPICPNVQPGSEHIVISLVNSQASISEITQLKHSNNLCLN